MIAAAAWIVVPSRTCFTGQVLAALLPFLYGVPFTIALYEMTTTSTTSGGSHLLWTGVARFASAILNTFILASGVVVGMWLAGTLYAGQDCAERTLLQDCAQLQNTVSTIGQLVYYPFVCIIFLMFLKISPTHWPVCLVVQLAGIGSQLWLTVGLESSVMMSNVVPPFLATIVAHVAIVTLHRLNLSTLTIPRTAYLTIRNAASTVASHMPTTLYYSKKQQQERQYNAY